MTIEEFELKVCQLMSGSASDQECKEVLELLKSSEEFRQVYCKQNLLHALLSQRANGLKSLSAPTPIIPMKVLQQSQRKKNIRWISTMSAAALLALGLFLSTFFIQPTTHALSFVTAPETKFELIHDFDSPVDGNEMREGSILRLERGSVKLTFNSGVESVVEAPADLTLAAENTLLLKRGRAWFHVPERAVGFTVTTPDIEVVDLGTEFGILAAASTGDTCHVFDGAVTVRSLYEDAEPEKLVAGQAVEVSEIGTLVSLPPAPERFLTKLPDGGLHLHWSFDELDGSSLSCESSYPTLQNVETQIVSDGPAEQCLVEGKMGKALQLSHKGDHVMSDWSGIEGSQARTVAFWIKSPGDKGLFHSLVGWGDRGVEHAHQPYFLLFTRGLEDGSSRICLSTGSFEVLVDETLAENRWHHVACVYHGKESSADRPRVEFYVDGKLSGSSHFDYLDQADKIVLDTQTHGEDASPLAIGTSLDADPNYDYPKGASLDELHVIGRALNAEEIQALIKQ